MPKSKTPDDEFIRLFEEFGAAETARRLGQGVRDIYARRKGLEGRIKRQLRKRRLSEWPEFDEDFWAIATGSDDK